MLGLSLGQLYDELLLFGQEAVASITLTRELVAGPQVNLAWTTAGVTSETGYLIEVRDATAGDPFAELDTVGPDIAVYQGDLGPFTAGHRYEHHVTVVGGPSDGVVSNTVASFGAGGRTTYAALANASARRMPYRRGR